MVLSPDGAILVRQASKTIGLRSSGTSPGVCRGAIRCRTRGPAIWPHSAQMVRSSSPEVTRIAAIRRGPARPEIPVANAPPGSIGCVQFWDVATGKPASEGLAPRFPPQEIQFRPDGNLLMLKILSVPELWCIPLRDPGMGYTWNAGTALGGDKKSAC